MSSFNSLYSCLPGHEARQQEQEDFDAFDRVASGDAGEQLVGLDDGEGEYPLIQLVFRKIFLRPLSRREILAYHVSASNRYAIRCKTMISLLPMTRCNFIQRPCYTALAEITPFVNNELFGLGSSSCLMCLVACLC